MAAARPDGFFAVCGKILTHFHEKTPNFGTKKVENFGQSSASVRNNKKRPALKFAAHQAINLP